MIKMILTRGPTHLWAMYAAFFRSSSACFPIEVSKRETAACTRTVEVRLARGVEWRETFILFEGI